MRVVVLAALAVLLADGTARAQAAGGKPWSFSASAYTYVLPDDANYVQPTLAADRGWLHLEGRFNYEDLDTGSVWCGYNFSAGGTVTLDIAPMVGVVFGNTNGLAPGYRGALGWRWFTLSSETEYVISTGESADSFLYTWSELEFAPEDWCRLGVVIQRTKAYATEFDIQRGFFAGVSYGRADVTAYVFNPDADRPTFVVGVGVNF